MTGRSAPWSSMGPGHSVVTDRRRKRRLSEARIDAIMRRRALGEPADVIGSDYGISGDAVRGLIRRRKRRFAEICRDQGINPERFGKRAMPTGIPGSKAIWTPTEIDLLKAYFPSSLSVHKIAALTHH